VKLYKGLDFLKKTTSEESTHEHKSVKTRKRVMAILKSQMKKCVDGLGLSNHIKKYGSITYKKS